MVKNLLSNIRFYVLAASFIVSVGIYLFITSTTALSISQTAKLVEIYGLLSIFFLYISLLAGPLCYRFKFPGNTQFLHSRRALGVSAFYFALLHVLISLFKQLGGISGLQYLDFGYSVAVWFGIGALIVMFLLTVTSIDYAVKKLTFRKWKLLHRFIYLATIFLLIHMVMLGSDYSTLSDLIPKITFVALAILLFLEAPRVDIYLKRCVYVPRFGLSFVMITILLTSFYFTAINPISNNQVTFDIHAVHKQLAAAALNQSQSNGVDTSNPKLLNIPGLNGDRTKRYSVAMITDPPNPQPNEDTTIRFQITDAATGDRVTFFHILFAKPMHMIVVNHELTYFAHIHPTQIGQDFVVTTQFPTENQYRIYIEFQPFGGIEQTFGFNLNVGTPTTLQFSNTKPDINKPKIFGDYLVSVDTHGTLSATPMSLGEQTITFIVKDAKTGKPITHLKPYLAAFGHLTMINEKTFDFIHVHPYETTAPPPDSNGGPTVDFLPIGIYGPFKPGIYRAFAEFNPSGTLFTADFTVEIK